MLCCVCVWLCARARVCVCVYIYIYMYVCMYGWMYMCVYILYIFSSLSLSLSLSLSVSLSLYLFICLSICLSICIWVSCVILYVGVCVCFKCTSYSAPPRGGPVMRHIPQTPIRFYLMWKERSQEVEGNTGTEVHKGQRQKHQLFFLWQPPK